ncbi:hypothetical protein M427DRAFT_69018 [Gonapodya prolifera JEL478]|uniref:Uncharacterized protein n=1 Tax=Gonapodya prolifera (strain JEL478) TaxID=1344416 RepID=A0A139AJ46_GONPJ|nr:hypothetical protein M427DRAFT_69018 [Gonapodya prolifera JEL478]|eukprot:KXS16415.1 hypothetical protein M427DRAFT_69018 [Gonapodya prolifera JEL478]
MELRRAGMPRDPRGLSNPRRPTLLSHLASLLPPVLTHADVQGVPAPSKAVVQPGKVYITQRGYKAEWEGDVGVGPRDQAAVTRHEPFHRRRRLLAAIVLIKDEASARREANASCASGRVPTAGAMGLRRRLGGRVRMGRSVSATPASKHVAKPANNAPSAASKPGSRRPRRMACRWWRREWPGPEVLVWEGWALGNIAAVGSRVGMDLDDGTGRTGKQEKV